MAHLIRWAFRCLTRKNDDFNVIPHPGREVQMNHMIGISLDLLTKNRVHGFVSPMVSVFDKPFLKFVIPGLTRNPVGHLWIPACAGTTALRFAIPGYLGEGKRLHFLPAHVSAVPGHNLG